MHLQAVALGQEAADRTCRHAIRQERCEGHLLPVHETVRGRNNLLRSSHSGRNSAEPRERE